MKEFIPLIEFVLDINHFKKIKNKMEQENVRIHF